VKGGTYKQLGRIRFRLLHYFFYSREKVVEGVDKKMTAGTIHSSDCSSMDFIFDMEAYLREWYRAHASAIPPSIPNYYESIGCCSFPEGFHHPYPLTGWALEKFSFTYSRCDIIKVRGIFREMDLTINFSNLEYKYLTFLHRN
jgi:hypothetical protein